MLGNWTSTSTIASQAVLDAKCGLTGIPGNPPLLQSSSTVSAMSAHSFARRVNGIGDLVEDNRGVAGCPRANHRARVKYGKPRSRRYMNGGDSFIRRL
jgi:hypothetical protein